MRNVYCPCNPLTGAQRGKRCGQWHSGRRADGRQRQHPAPVSGRGGSGKQSWREGPAALRAQRTAALPAIKTLVNAQVHLNTGLQPCNSCIKRSPGHRMFMSVAYGGGICRWILPKRATARMPSNSLQGDCQWGDEPPDGAWQSAHALVTLAGHLADVLADADRMAAGSSTASGAAAPAAEPATKPAAAAGAAANSPSAGPADDGAGSPTTAERQAAWQACTAAAGQPDTSELVVTAAAGAVVVASWAVSVLERVRSRGSGVGASSKRLEQM
jgi:hypothetical protein